MARSLALLLAVGAAPVPGDPGPGERRVPLASFDRVRVQGALAVSVAAARSPVAVVAGDAAAAAAVEVRVDGATLTLRRPPGTAGPVTVSVGSDALAGASVVGAGELRAARMAGARVDLAVTGAGSVAVAALDAAAVVATLVGDGMVTLAGRAGQARLLTNGTGTVDADALTADDLFVRVDGAGETRARARYQARVIDTGRGRVTVAGQPRCLVTAPPDAAVTCHGYVPGAVPAARP